MSNLEKLKQPVKLDPEFVKSEMLRWKNLRDARSAEQEHKISNLRAYVERRRRLNNNG